MIRASKYAWCAFVAGALLLGAAVAQAQESGGAAVNPALASRGKSLFASRGCNGCHTVGKGKLAGPDLIGVTGRRSSDWLKKWLKDPTQMIGSDSVADALVVEAKGAKMPNLHLNDGDIDALMNYFASEDAKKK